jgi:hypothetical protein
VNIGIIGPPGAGKSKLARQIKAHLAVELDASYEDGVEPTIAIVDNYAQKIQRETNLALGPWASYSENFMVAGTRRAAELKARKSNLTTVTLTVGTIVDTLLYCAMHSDALINGAWEENLPVAQRWVQAAMPAAGLWYRETWDYDLAVFCPCADDAENWQQSYTREMPGIFSSFMVNDVIGRSEDTLDYIAEKLAATDKSGV